MQLKNFKTQNQATILQLLKKLKWTLFAISLSSEVLLLNACVSVPDVPVCTNLGLKGYCIWTISNKEQTVDEVNLLEGKKWSEVTRQSVILPVSSWVKVKGFIENSCHQSNQCSNGVGTWQQKLNQFNQKVGGG